MANADMVKANMGLAILLSAVVMMFSVVFSDCLHRQGREKRDAFPVVGISSQQVQARERISGTFHYFQVSMKEKFINTKEIL
ncbi:hypothetical protein [Endozoicomonas sp. SESOKO1]|uniref:hypothetical protein n=1 Tax=Endozoicomonas sp. SESOKO1 TaxID=2828742 RepID=UPI002147DD97|nr:hypothetical protein [Endozoicomonas sp. SESOKO1]